MLVHGAECSDVVVAESCIVLAHAVVVPRDVGLARVPDRVGGGPVDNVGSHVLRRDPGSRVETSHATRWLGAWSALSSAGARIAPAVLIHTMGRSGSACRGRISVTLDVDARLMGTTRVPSSPPRARSPDHGAWNVMVRSASPPPCSYLRCHSPSRTIAGAAFPSPVQSPTTGMSPASTRP